MKRNFSNWLKSFLEYTEGVESPPIFRKWAGIGAISGVLQRRVSIKTRTGLLYPNEFIMLVSKPGIGKTVAIDTIENLLRQTSDKINILPTTSTKEQIYNEFQEKAIREIRGADIDIMCAAIALPDELGVFIRANDFDFMQNLIKFYDCKKLFTYKIKHGEGNRLENVSLTLIGGTQPDTLRKILPAEAFGMGFAARLILVYSDQKIKHEVFGKRELDKAHEALLVQDLQAMFQMAGRMLFTPEAEKVIERWYAEGQKPVPTDRRLASYNERRLLHILKLSMIFAAGETNELIIHDRHVEGAMETLIEAENDMPKAFSAMGEGTSINQIENVYSFIQGELLRNGKDYIHESVVRDNLLREVPIYSIKATIQEMMYAGWITIEAGFEGDRLIRPKRRPVGTPANADSRTKTGEN